MKIAIEAQRIFRPDKHGMDFVALETIRELQKRNDGNEYYIIVAPGKDHCLEESANLSIVEVACPTYPLWEQIALPLAVKRLGADLLHCTSTTHICHLMSDFHFSITVCTFSVSAPEVNSDVCVCRCLEPYTCTS